MHGPGKVENACDTESTPDCAVAQEVERQHGVRSAALPDDEDGNAKDTDHERRNDFCGAPLRGNAACDREGLLFVSDCMVDGSVEAWRYSR